MSAKGESQRLIEPTHLLLAGSLLVKPTVVSSHHTNCPVQVLNMSKEDTWLHPRTRIGLLLRVELVDNDPGYKLTFQRIFANAGEISLGAVMPRRQEVNFHYRSQGAS